MTDFSSVYLVAQQTCIKGLLFGRPRGELRGSVGQQRETQSNERLRETLGKTLKEN